MRGNQLQNSDDFGLYFDKIWPDVYAMDCETVLIGMCHWARYVIPVFRNNKFTTHSGIPTTSAARFTRVLLEKNLILTLEEASGRRPALYSFEPLMELVRV